jgi:hypothetical protein
MLAVVDLCATSACAAQGAVQLVWRAALQQRPRIHAKTEDLAIFTDFCSRRYERGLHTAGTGSLVRQKHAATKAEGMVAHGSRLVVRGGGAERAASDEQLLTPPAVTHDKSHLL